MSPIVRSLCAAGLGAALVLPGLAHAGDAACDPLSRVQKRVVQKAEVGVESLRDYVFITRGIYALNMMEIAKSLDGWVARAHCAGMAVDDAAVRRTVALVTVESNRR